jgi:DNA-binding beta-propeller fold protein YncE
MFGANVLDGHPDPGQRIDPNNVFVGPGDEHWPHIDQPFRSWPTALALTPDGSKLYVSPPGREGYPDRRVAVVDTATRRVVSWVDLRGGQTALGTRPVGITVSPDGKFVVVLDEYANFASVIDTSSNRLTGEFETGFFPEKAVFNAMGTRLYASERANPANGADGPNGRVHAFQVDAGPKFTKLADIPTGANALESSHPRDLALSTDQKTLYVANTLGNRVAAINVANLPAINLGTDVTTLPLGGLATDVKLAGRWGIVSGHETNNCLNQPETGHGLPTSVGGQFVRNNGAPLGYLPVMSDCTRATTFDDIGTELNIFAASTTGSCSATSTCTETSRYWLIRGGHGDPGLH